MTSSCMIVESVETTLLNDFWTKDVCEHYWSNTSPKGSHMNWNNFFCHLICRNFQCSVLILPIYTHHRPNPQSQCLLQSTQVPFMPISVNSMVLQLSPLPSAHCRSRIKQHWSCPSDQHHGPPCPQHSCYSSLPPTQSPSSSLTDKIYYSMKFVPYSTDEFILSVHNYLCTTLLYYTSIMQLLTGVIGQSTSKVCWQADIHVLRFCVAIALYFWCNK